MSKIQSLYSDGPDAAMNYQFLQSLLKVYIVNLSTYLYISLSISFSLSILYTYPISFYLLSIFYLLLSSSIYLSIFYLSIFYLSSIYLLLSSPILYYLLLSSSIFFRLLLLGCSRVRFDVSTFIAEPYHRLSHLPRNQWSIVYRNRYSSRLECISLLPIV